MVDLYLGQIVESHDPVTTRHFGKPERGVVIAANGKGRADLSPTGYVVQKGWGVYCMTDNGHGYWVEIPVERTTALERVRSAAASWGPPEWLEPGAEIDDCDSFVWALLHALVPPDDDAYEFDTPLTEELAEHVADYIDRMSAQRRSLDDLRGRFEETVSGR